MPTQTAQHLTPAALARRVDRLGQINAQIARLQAQAAAIKADLIAEGDGEIEGRLFRAVIIARDGVRLDGRRAREYLTEAEIAACEVPVHSVAVTLYDR